MFAQMIGMAFLFIELELQKLRAGMESLLAANEEKVTVNRACLSAPAYSCVCLYRTAGVCNVLYPLSFELVCKVAVIF